MKKILRLINCLRSRYVDYRRIFSILSNYNLLYRAEDILITSTGVLILYFKDTIIKVPLGGFSEQSLKKEYTNYLEIKSTNLARLVDYGLCKKGIYYEVDKLRQVEKIAEKDVEKIVSLLENTVFLGDSIPDLSFNLVNKWCNKSICSDFIYESSCMHGDLTPKNIMLNSRGDFVLIDLDRFSCNGIRGVDILHFRIERKCKECGFDFLDWILRYLEDFDNKKMLFCYFIYRVNVENFNGILLSDEYYKKTCMIYDKFILYECL